MKNKEKGKHQVLYYPEVEGAELILQRAESLKSSVEAQRRHVLLVPSCRTGHYMLHRFLVPVCFQTTCSLVHVMGYMNFVDLHDMNQGSDLKLLMVRYGG